MRALVLVVAGGLSSACGGSDDAGLFAETGSGSAGTTGGSLVSGSTGGSAATDADVGNDSTTSDSTTSDSTTSDSTTTGAATGGAPTGTTVSDDSSTTGSGGTGDVGSGGNADGGASTGDSAGTGGSPGTGGTAVDVGTGGVAATTGAAGTGGIPVDGSITFQEVCEFTPCGGELQQDYEYVGACMEESVVLGRYSDCSGIELIEASGTIEGTVSFQDGDLEQDVVLDMTAEYFVPAQCLTLQNCNLAGVALQSDGFDQANCENGDGGCNCSVSLTTSADASSTYSTDDDQLTLGASEVSYCASGGTLQYTNAVGDLEYVLQAEAD